MTTKNMTFKMEKAKAFEDYFTDPRMSEMQLDFFAKVRLMVREILPDVEERVGYAMPGFYAKMAKNLKETLFFITPAENWVTLSGVQGINQDLILPWKESGVKTVGTGSLRVPYILSDEQLRALFQVVINYNLERYLV
ncbi:MAG: DUF1801 domain-containing protein [Streptococcaceae bacterium]|jgi:uncharacterized protein YdhG (YjbR/CyaY superfamily)|nr:DUF1801 domain-containing protein [Streptococcaceae bacterium]